MAITPDMVKQLREMTGAGMMDCKNALVESKGDVNLAVELLRKKGVAKAAKKIDRVTTQGIVYSYIHHNEKVGVLLVLGCETDFVARTQDFHDLAKKISLQIASMSPRWLSKEDVPEDILSKEKEIYIEEVKASGKPANIVDKIVENKINKFYEENCLLDQIYVFGEGEKVKDLITQVIAKIGENIKVDKFTRYAIGE
ncbi:MAG TPA: translation elongation factor Ts [Petrotogaceae bacterium]|jgi:elongation factor Ts|nr:translation elongation factor Ts [Petrotogaceae bacterium]HPG47973.1 translation elongation factor Ts [Petrotogaceae bacterium]HPO26897.1 translation elongation factor Ts [Petrotogaceae bacterium]HQF33688.1 translation elongation factor Ts [Petrotogaceae bacterium]HQH32511.1 translation elongation factor Ts [Petrotogaceae bacterium]